MNSMLPEPTGDDRILVGWREVVVLPDLRIKLLCKIDTGAKTSALHATDLETFEKDGDPWLRFVVHPRRKNFDVVRVCEAPVVTEREVKNSGGQTELRFVVRTRLRLGPLVWESDLTLTDRTEMGYRMLLGRRSMVGRIQVDPALSYVQGRWKTIRRKGPAE